MLFSHSCLFYFPFPPRTWEFTTWKQTLGNQEISVVISTHTTRRAADLQQNTSHKLIHTVQLAPPWNKTTPCKTYSLKSLSLQDTLEKLCFLLRLLWKRSKAGKAEKSHLFLQQSPWGRAQLLPTWDSHSLPPLCHSFDIKGQEFIAIPLDQWYSLQALTC